MKTNCVNHGPQWGEFVDTQEPDGSQGCICQHHLLPTPGPISAILSPAIQTPHLPFLPGHTVRFYFPASFVVRWNHITNQWVLANGMWEEVIYTTSYPIHKYFQSNPPCSPFSVLPDINDRLQSPRAWLSQRWKGPGSLGPYVEEPPKVVTLTRNIWTGFLCEKLIFCCIRPQKYCSLLQKVLPTLTIFQATPQLKQHSSPWT